MPSRTLHNSFGIRGILHAEAEHLDRAFGLPLHRRCLAPGSVLAPISARRPVSVILTRVISLSCCRRPRALGCRGGKPGADQLDAAACQYWSIRSGP
jgi:hypothetical protein